MVTFNEPNTNRPEGKLIKGFYANLDNLVRQHWSLWANYLMNLFFNKPSVCVVLSNSLLVVRVFYYFFVFTDVTTFQSRFRICANDYIYVVKHSIIVVFTDTKL